MGAKTVHPRWRGEHAWRNIEVEHYSGSSPLARGTRWRAGYWMMSRRFIPAGAGNTAGRSEWRAALSVHPRWRGEHVYSLLKIQIERGSSPLARGTHGTDHPADLRHRFIPAGAGNTSTARWRACSATVHPRWRGEHVTPAAKKSRFTWFIPAGAGNTRLLTAGRWCTSVHPRWRGEHARSTWPTRRTTGSSPLARGTPGRGRERHPERRFIPAGAGNTAWRRMGMLSCPVHPRWRGEHAGAGRRGARGGGSSPLARGTPGLHLRAVGEGRFIPAGAGNTGG